MLTCAHLYISIRVDWRPEWLGWQHTHAPPQTSQHSPRSVGRLVYDREGTSPLPLQTDPNTTHKTRLRRSIYYVLRIVAERRSKPISTSEAVFRAAKNKQRVLTHLPAFAGCFCCQRWPIWVYPPNRLPSVSMPKPLFLIRACIARSRRWDDLLRPWAALLGAVVDRKQKRPCETFFCWSTIAPSRADNAAANCPILYFDHRMLSL